MKVRSYQAEKLPHSKRNTKKIINSMKRQPMEWDKIFANHIYNKGLIFKIYKELLQLESKKKKKSKYNLKVDKEYEQTFLKRRHTYRQQLHEKMFNLTNHQGNTNQIHIKTFFHNC